MNITIVTCYESNEERISFVLDACKKRKYNVKVITTDFSHIKKQKRSNVPSGYIALPTIPYNKNLSITRLRSHNKFAKDAFKLIGEDLPDLIWLMAPANSLISEANKFKQKYNDVKIIIDIIDMWPESLPININKNIFPLNIWRNIRKNSINCADGLVTECDFYQEILGSEYHKPITTIHWCKDIKASKSKEKLSNDVLSLCYLGSINNLVDSEAITNFIYNCNMPVTLHVIGEGENRYNFVNVNSRACEVIYHGPIRNELEKSKILTKCHAGLNIYKKGLYIGLTVKSIDYFANGLPIINNIKGDTWSLIDKYNIGINIDDDYVADGNKIIELRNKNAKIYKLYNENFTKEIFIKKCLAVIDEVIK